MDMQNWGVIWEVSSLWPILLVSEIKLSYKEILDPCREQVLMYSDSSLRCFDGFIRS
jgi:hypothetical protein